MNPNNYNAFGQRVDMQTILATEIREARRRFKLHILWSTACAALTIGAFFAGVVTGAVTVLK